MDYINLSEEEKQNIMSQMFNSLSQAGQTQMLHNFQASQQQQQHPNCGNIFDALSDGIKEYLKEHQKEAIDFLYKRIIQPPNGFYNKDGGEGAIIAHNMGLGKTTTTAAFLYGILSEPAIKNLNYKILIVSPVNVIEHWISEFKKDIWGGFFENEATVCQLDSNQRSTNRDDPHDIRRMQIADWYKGIKNKTILILGYEIYDKMLSNDQDDKTLELLKQYIQTPGPDVVIYDESHRLKNNKTISYATKMIMNTKRRILLTGTPLENGPMELYHIVQMAVPEFLGPKNDYYRKYAQKIERGMVTDAVEEERKISRETEEKLYEELKEVMNRKDVEYLQKLINITKKEITITFCETQEQKRLMDQAEIEYENAGRGDKVFLKYYNHLLYLTSHPVITEVKQRERPRDRKLSKCTSKAKDPKRSNKMRALFYIIEDCKANDEKLVVYTQSRPTLDYIEHQLSTLEWEKGVDFFRIDGECKSKQRASDIEKFNAESNRKAKLFLLTIKAGSVGINLIGAYRMVMFDHCFNPVHNTQATYRIYRIGQERDVFVYRFITKNSTDDCVLRRQIAKESQSKRTIDGKKVAPQFSQQDISIRRGHEAYKLISAERIEELEDEFEDELLINTVQNNLKGVIEVSNHDENFEETF
uniref:Uncharacterized protein n=1 Tax=Panagrolaimus sp. ES5 TaxID=591445 RepID=A0AC34FNP4_9BILA